MTAYFKGSIIRAVVGAALLILACPARGQVAETIYVGGEIVTVDRNQPFVEAVAVADGKILAVGARAAIELNHKAATTRVVDLAGRTLLPSFIDAHSHYFNSLLVSNQVCVYPPPSGPGKDRASIVAELVKFRDGKKISKGVWVRRECHARRRRAQSRRSRQGLPR